MYISSVLYTILAIIQWVTIQKKPKPHYAQKWMNNILSVNPHQCLDSEHISISYICDIFVTGIKICNKER